MVGLNISYGDSLLNTLNSPRRFHYDGDELVGEYILNPAKTAWVMSRRYVHGRGVDDPVFWYEGSTLSNPRFLHINHQGSIIAVTDGTSNHAIAINSYDEWGIPAATNIGRFQYSLPESCVGHMVK